MLKVKLEKSNNSVNSTISYLDLLTDNAPQVYDEYSEEAKILDTQINKSNVHNIAVVAKYGAGKSSVINTYLSQYRSKNQSKKNQGQKLSEENHYTRISLSTFNETEYDETAIERSILQQLLYSRKKSALPNSEIKRTNKTSIIRAVYISLLFTLLISGIALFGFDVNHNLFNISWLKYLFLGISMVTLFLIICFCFFYQKLRRIKYKDFETEFYQDGNKNETKQISSLINKFVDEVLYFFECIDIDLVIFEDLDRLPNTDIFVKLRELNTIINSSAKSKNKVTFLYAVRDDLFKTEEERAKFFDFILPIVPVINPVTTQEKMEDKLVRLKEFNSNMDLTGKFIKCVSHYIPDMRILNNTFNDYIFMYHKIFDDDNVSEKLKSENLFALSLYKNLFPYDYALLEKGIGLIPQIVNVNELRMKAVKVLENRIKDIKIKIEAINSERLNSFEELKAMFIGQLYQMPVDNSRYGNIDARQIKTFEGLDFKLLIHPTYPYNYSVKLNRDNAEILTFSGEHYLDKEKLINLKADNCLEKYKQELSELELQIQEIYSLDFASIVNHFGVEFCFDDSCKENYILKVNNEREIVNNQFSYLRMLIAQNYIDEHYIEYTSNYKSMILSPNDAKAIQFIQSRKLDFHMYVENFCNVIRWLNDDDFSVNSILTDSLFSKIDELYQFSYRENDNKYNNLVHLLSQRDNEYLKRVIGEYISIADYDKCETLFKHLLPVRSYTCEEMLELGLLENDKIDHLIVNSIKYIEDYSILNECSLFVDYINKHKNYLTLFEKVGDDDKVLMFLSSLNIKFEVIDCNETEGKLKQYIIQNNKYVLSYENLKTIFNIDKDAEKLSSFINNNYDYILNSSQEVVIDYIKSNINTYVRDILLDSAISCKNEPYSRMLELLQNDNITNENKKSLIKKCNVVFDDITIFNDELFSTLLDNNVIAAKWCNILIAYARCGFDTVKKFMTSNTRIEGSFECSEAIPPNTPELFIRDMLLSLTPFEIKSVAQTLPTTMLISLKEFKDITIDDTVLSTFIEEGKVQYDNNDLSLIYGKEKTLCAYLKYHNDTIISKFNDFFSIVLPKTYYSARYAGVMTAYKQINTQTIIANVIACQGIDTRIKNTLIEKCSEIIKIDGYEHIYANYVLLENQKIPVNILWQFSRDFESVSREKRKKILIHNIDIINIPRDLEKLREYLRSFGENWDDLFNNQELRLEKSDINEQLIRKLKLLILFKSYNRKGYIFLKTA